MPNEIPLYYPTGDSHLPAAWRRKQLDVGICSRFPSCVIRRCPLSDKTLVVRWSKNSVPGAQRFSPRGWLVCSCTHRRVYLDWTSVMRAFTPKRQQICQRQRSHCADKSSPEGPRKSHQLKDPCSGTLESGRLAALPKGKTMPIWSLVLAHLISDITYVVVDTQVHNNTVPGMYFTSYFIYRYCAYQSRVVVMRLASFLESTFTSGSAGTPYPDGSLT